MRKSRFSEDQIVAILKEANAGLGVKELARRHSISPATFYNWRARYGEKEASPTTQIRELANELAQYKNMYAELAGENYSLKILLREKKST